MGATLLYLGGAFLNDAFDLDYDRLCRPHRPIPSGVISQQAVWRWGVALLVAGSLLLFWCGPVTGALGLALVVFIVLFDAAHRLTAISPVFMGSCRFFLYVLAASVSDHGVSGWSIWCGLAMAAYVIGLGCLAAWHEKPKRTRPWPVALLAIPVALALIMDAGRYRESGLLLSAVLALWTLRSLRQTFWSLEPNFGRTMEGLQAGIVFVDWLATCPANFVERSNPATRNVSIVFLVLFALTLLARKLARNRKPVC